MRKMMRIAAGLAALVLVAVMAGCKGKEKSNVAAKIVGEWGYKVTHEVPEGIKTRYTGGDIIYSYDEIISYRFETDGSYSYEDETNIMPLILRSGTYSVNAKQGKIVLSDSEGNGDVTFEIKGDTLVDEGGKVFTKY